MTKTLSNYAICRLMIAFVWLYHGIFPKLLGPHEDELAMSMAVGLSESQAVFIAMAAGVGEVMMAAIIVLCWHALWPLIITMLAMVGLLAVSLFAIPELGLGAFNPVTTNLPVLALAIVCYRLAPKV